ncbi:uncharacterized protein C8Q71DRAFT_449894 [Rhodofomes roseus]|uniref:Uncharacterized protein n=1 Tax=Rhodofomes roseus TaxID=34475 RepID=A0ABQ8JY00_9APHY|nr:uncharacterized protein C8Q71DRAFT_449894 [Rhodofomes roseus]KAH9829118.1 hypothetical protein C8Q71DRAFT_449894 [Rhodofomes roseus]
MMHSIVRSLSWPLVLRYVPATEHSNPRHHRPTRAHCVVGCTRGTVGPRPGCRRRYTYFILDIIRDRIGAAGKRRWRYEAIYATLARKPRSVVASREGALDIHSASLGWKRAAESPSTSPVHLRSIYGRRTAQAGRLTPSDLAVRTRCLDYGQPGLERDRFQVAVVQHPAPRLVPTSISFSAAEGTFAAYSDPTARQLFFAFLFSQPVLCLTR